MDNTPRGLRLHIALFGRRNTGKSSLINAITRQEIALVSEIPGTTTDPVYKSMELLPVGPVDDQPVYDYSKGVTLRAYRIREGAAIAIPDINGRPSAAASVRRVEGEVFVEASPELDYTLEVIE
jgi:GTPase SAR1 family protein